MDYKTFTAIAINNLGNFTNVLCMKTTKQTLQERLNKEVLKNFIQYRGDDGYNGGEEGLRCDKCDQKYRGETSIMQLCPVCQAQKLVDFTTSQTLQELLDEVEGERITKDHEDYDFWSSSQGGWNRAIDTITTIIKRKMESLDAEGK